MPTPQQRLDLDRVLRTLGDCPAAVCILVTDTGELETATVGIDNDEALFEIVFSVANQLAAELFANLPPSQQRLKIVLPTVDQARQLGLTKKGK